jgi:hypothetical protein
VITFNATVINRGFAAPHTARPVHLVLTRTQVNKDPTDNSTSPIVASTELSNVDIRSWQPRSVGDPFRLPLVHRLSGQLVVAPEVESGTYAIGLYLPDVLNSAGNRTDFAVRLANDIPWLTWGEGGRWGGVNVMGEVNLLRTCV